jgi:hypothetical protein
MTALRGDLSTPRPHRTEVLQGEIGRLRRARALVHMAIEDAREGVGVKTEPQGVEMRPRRSMLLGLIF